MRHSFILLLYTGLLALASCSNSSDDMHTDEMITIKLVEDVSYTIKSDNPISIKKGDDACFEVEFDESYEFDESSEGTYDYTTKIYTLENVMWSRDVLIKTKVKGYLKLNIENNDKLGDVKVTPAKQFYSVGDYVTLEVSPKDGNEFMCFTKTNPYRADGNWKPSGKPLSFTSSYTFQITDNITIYSNYFSSNLLRINYFANGGKTIDGLDCISLDYTIPYQFTSPTTMLGTHYLYRDNFTLESYNTKADGTGVRIGIGSSVHIDNAVDNVISLYAQWAEWTPYNDFSFKYNEEADSYSITKYNGNDNTVVLPSIYNDKKVTSICKSSFENKTMHTLIFTPDISLVDDESIVNCANLENVVMFTSITKIGPSFVFECPNFTKLMINNTLYCYNSSKRNQDLIGQLQTISSIEKQKIILYGPSTLRYNQTVEPFQMQYPDKFVYLCGLQGGSNYKLGLELLLNYLKKDDYLLFQLYPRSLELDSAGMDTLTYLKYDFDILQKVNISDYLTNFFKVFPQFVYDFKSNQNDDIYLNQRFGGYDETGMHEYESNSDDPNNKDPSTVYAFDKYLKKKNFDYIIEFFSHFGLQNDHLLPCWSSYNINSVTNTDTFERFENYAKQIFENLTFFDSIFDNIYPGDYFRVNDSIHLSMKGCAHRAENWCKKLSEKNCIK